jgi:cation transporter-like permease
MAVFFVPYVLCEVTSNLLLVKFSRPSYHMGTLVICWGLVMTFTGVVKSFGALVATRFLLGIFEYDLPSAILRYAVNVANLLQSRFLLGCDLGRQPVVSTT